MGMGRYMYVFGQDRKDSLADGRAFFSRLWQCALGCLLLSALPMLMWGQSSDFQTRTGIKVTQDLRKGWEVSAGYQLRTYQYARSFRGSYLTLDVSKKLTDAVDGLFEFRYATSPRWDKFRFGIGFMAKTKVGKITFSAKPRYQYEHFLQSWPEIGQFPARQNFRLKLEAERKVVKNLRGHISIEPQVRLDGRYGRFQRIRNIIGLEWEIAKRHHLDASYYYQPQFSSAEVKHVHIAELTYAWDLPKWGKGKKKDKE
jgi:hypothetical protein